MHTTLAERPMTPALKRKLTRVAAQPDSQIDFSEIPPPTEKFWKNAVRNPFRRRAQQQLTVRLDADLVAWLQRQGEDYESKLNGLLRKAMQHEIRRQAQFQWPICDFRLPIFDCPSPVLRIP